MSNPELKRCPFCGSDKLNFDYLDSDDGDGVWQVLCLACDTKTFLFNRNMDQAIEAWNHRAGEEK